MDQTKLSTAVRAVSDRSTEEDIPKIMQYGEPRHLKKGEMLLKEGERCQAFYLVESGYLRTWYNKDGVPINLNFTFEGEFTCNLQSYRSRQPSE